MEIALELVKALGPAGAAVVVALLWVRSERSRWDSSEEERKELTQLHLEAATESAATQAATLSTLRMHTELLKAVEAELRNARRGGPRR